MLGLGPNRDRASVELAARQIAKEQGISVNEVYKQAGGSRAMFNPEGRAPLPAIGEAAVVAGQSTQDIPSAFANTVLRAIRGGDISGGEGSFLDYAIKQTETPDRKVDKNYEDLGGLGKSLGYSFATMGASILSGAAAGLVTANPLVGGATMMGTSGAVSYRASKDEFLDRVKTQLNNKTKQLYGRELTKDEWQSVRGDFESAAIKYGSWEAATEAVGNLLMIKAFSAPAKGMNKSALNKLVERTASIGVENIGETATGVGQRQAEIEAGLSKEELSVKDAFKQQFLSTMLLGGTMAAGAKGKEIATDFYKKYVEPKVSPQSALGRAIMADLEDAVVNPQGVDAQAISALQGAEALTLDELAKRKDALKQGEIEPKLSPNAEPPEEEMITSTAPGISVSYPKERAEPSFTIDPETGEVITAPAAQVESEALIEREAQRYAKTYNLPLDLATEVVRGQYARGELDDESRTGVDAGRTEPSISMPVEGATTTQGVTPPDTSGLVAPVGDNGRADVGERAERTTLDESLIPTLTERAPTPDESLIPTLTERAPAPTPAATYAELPAEDKVPVLQEAQQMWQAGEANLPIAKAWNSLPSWKRDMFAAQVYENYDEITTNPEAFRAAIDKVVEAKKPTEAKVEAKEPVVAEPVVETPAAPVLSEEDQARLQSAQRNAAEAQATLDFLADRGFTTPEQNYGVEAAQNKLAKAQETINQFEPPVKTIAPIVQQAQAKLADAEAAVAAATTPEAKKEATAQRNAARQEVKKVEAAAPVKQQTQRTEEEQKELERVDAENNIGKPQLRKRLESGQLPMIDSLSQGDGSITYFAKGVGSTNPDFLVKLDLLPEEKRAARIAEADMELADSQEERNTAREDLAKALQPAAERALATKTTPAATTPTAPKRGRPAKPKVEGTAPTAPKPRGRKKIQLTPEEQAFKDAERGVSQAEANKGSRDVDKLIKFLSSEFDPANPKSPEFTKVVTQGLDPVRREYIYKLNEFATKNAYRTKPASGGKARDFLTSSDKITQKERADLQARLNFEKTRPPKPSAARSRSTEKPVKAFYEFDRASQAIDYIMRNGTPFERALAARLKPLVGDVRLTVADTKENTPDAIQDLLGDAAGVYSSSRWGDKVHRMIVLRGENFDDPALQGVNNIIFLHEALHAATEAKIDQWQELTSLGLPVPPQLQMLVNDLFEVMGVAQAQYEALKASGQPISANLRHKMEKLDITNDPKEFVTYGMTDPDVQRFLLNAPGYTRKDQALGYIKNLFNQFVNSIRRSFNMDAKHQSALQDLVLVTEGLMQEQEIEPAYSVNTVLEANIEKADRALEKAQLSTQSGQGLTPALQSTSIRKFSIYQKTIEAGWSTADETAKKALLFTLPSSVIINWKKDQIPALVDIDKTTQYMSGMRQMLMSSYSKPAKALGKFAQKTGTTGMDALATTMHVARLTAVSPTLFTDRTDALTRDPRILELNREIASGTLNENQRRALDTQLQERRDAINTTFELWEGLGQIENGQKTYRMVRQFYKDTGALTRALLDRNIDRLGLEGDVTDPSTPKGRLMLSVRRMYEDSEVNGIKEYFPFMRHGDHVLEVYGPEGKERYQFDSQSDRDNYIAFRAEQLGLDPEDGSVFKAFVLNESAERDKVLNESKLLTDMFEAIESATQSDSLDKESLKDDLYQLYLSTLPERSFRKQFMHADNVPGFSSDILRNFKTSATNIARQAAKLRYSPELKDNIQRARDTLAGMPPSQQVELGTIVNEMERRGLEELNPREESSVANFAVQFSFYMLLTGVGSAILQTTALPAYVMPKLNSVYGYGKSAKAFAKWSTLYNSLGFRGEDVDGIRTMTAPTVGESSLVRNNPIYARAFNEALARDIVGQSYANMVIENRATPMSAKSRMYQNIGPNALKIMSGLFSGSERLTREISFMIAFDLEYAKSGDFDRAVNAAADIVHEYIGRFDPFERPPILRNPVGKIVLQFKAYAGVVTNFLVKNALAMSRFMSNPREARQAFSLLTGMLLFGTMFFGATGLPLYSVITATIDALLDSWEDEEGKLNRAAKALFGEQFAKEQTAERQRRIAKDYRTATSSDLRFRYEFLPTYFGKETFGGEDGKRYSLATMFERGPVSVLSDVSIGPRMSMDGIWWKEVKESETTKEQLKNWAEALLSPPAASGVGRVIDGVQDIVDGKYLRGASQATPAAVGNIAKTELIRQEGVVNKLGDKVLSKDEVSNTNLVAQITGLGSTRVAALQDQAFKLRNQELIAQNKRMDILKDLRKLVIDPEAGSDKSKEDYKKLFKRVEQHNKRYPMPGIAIEADTILNSAEAAMTAAGMSSRGSRVKENMAPYLLPLRQNYSRQIMGK